MKEELASLPAVHRLLSLPGLVELAAVHGRRPVREAVRATLEEARRRLANGSGVPDSVELAREVKRRLDSAAAAYPEVINATGVLIHTNLGRAPRVAAPLPPYLALEYDLADGQRGERLHPVVARLTRYFEAEAATVVTNNAAALVLLLAAQARDRDVVVSRGELIEIGGSFRLPEIMEAAGARLLAVGCTNRTHLEDYERAIGEQTAAILVVHRSNFHLSGFVTSPPLAELVALGHRRGVPVWVDQGSGCHLPLTTFGLRHEQTVAEILAAGVDAVLFSGDKLLGGPQAGIIVGTEIAVAPLRRHPLRRALRPDKSVLAALAATVDAFIAERPETVPLYRLLSLGEDSIRRRAVRLARRLRASGLQADPVRCRAVIGGGSTPDQWLPSWGVAMPGEGVAARQLRAATPPVIARVEEGRVLIDLRAVFPEQDRLLAETLIATVPRETPPLRGASA